MNEEIVVVIGAGRIILLADINDAIEAKYPRYGPRIVSSTVTPQARAATIKLVPR
jgi:hypothetical protein